MSADDDAEYKAVLDAANEKILDAKKKYEAKKKRILDDEKEAKKI